MPCWKCTPLSNGASKHGQKNQNQSQSRHISCYIVGRPQILLLSSDLIERTPFKLNHHHHRPTTAKVFFPLLRPISPWNSVIKCIMKHLGLMLARQIIKPTGKTHKSSDDTQIPSQIAFRQQEKQRSKQRRHNQNMHIETSQHCQRPSKQGKQFLQLSIKTTNWKF